MTAIAGFWHFNERAEGEDPCARMLAAQQVYGPHDGRQWSEGSVALGRRLYRTVPEDAYDRQPLKSTDGRLVLVADVRLDNREELIADLGLRHERLFHTCDAAILLACLERWGDAAVDRLVGDFAFAFWDRRAETLTLARDFLGQRPLHFHRGKDFFAFASMPKGLHALPDIPYAPDEQAMSEFLVLLPQSGPRSFFSGIERVEAGQVVTASRSGLSARHYWQPKRCSRPLSERECLEGVRYHLDLATKSRLRGIGLDVAGQLSGGFDSAAVVGTAARLLKEDGGKVVAFTAVPRAGYDGPVPKGRFADEGPHAAAVAAMYPNVEHVLIRADGPSPLEELDRMFFLFDRPMLNLCNWRWVSAINRAARERGLKILLNGQMGNMSISYSGLERLPELLRAGALPSLAREAWRLVAGRYMTWAGVLAQTFGPFVPGPLWRWLNRTLAGRAFDVLDYSPIRADRLAALNLERLAAERDLDFSYRPRADGFAARVWALRRVDQGNYNKGCLAGWGIDHRDPTADKRLVEFCLAVPSEHYLSDGVPRALGRKALADRVPERVLKERRKGYQAADWHEGLTAARREIVAELGRLVECAPAARTLDVPRLSRLVELWPTSGWERTEIIHRYRLALLRGIAAGHFLRKAVGAN